MVGPVVKIDSSTLPQRVNLHWLGQRNHNELPDLIAGCDACLLPFAMNESTRFISPIAALEYLAAGRPVLLLCERLLGTNVHWQNREAWIYSKSVHIRCPFQGALYVRPTT